MNRFRGKMCARAYTYKWDFLWHSLPNVQRQTKWKIIGIGNLMCVVRLWNSQCVRIFVSISQLARQNQILCHCRRRCRRYHHQPESHSTNLLSKKIIQTKANVDYVISKSMFSSFSHSFRFSNEIHLPNSNLQRDLFHLKNFDSFNQRKRL